MKNITNDKVTEYICQYYHPVDEELAHLREIGERDNVPIILKETELILTTLLNLKKPAKILEIGTAIGYSSIYFATMCPEAEIYTIEKNEQMLQAARHNIKEAGLDNRIHYLYGDGQEQIDKLRDQGICDFDFVFIDAAKSHYRRFFDAALSVSTPDAILVSDNVLQRGMTVADEYDTHGKHKTNSRNMREFVEYICNDPSMHTSLMSIGDGLAISTLRGDYEK